MVRGSVNYQDNRKNYFKMGGDGGVIAVKRAYLRACVDAKVDEGKEQQTRDNQIDRTRLCALTSQILGDHVVACELGNLYNKEAVIEALLSKSLPETFSHIKNLRDIKDCHFTENNNRSSSVSGTSGYSAINKYMCPITSVEFNGLHPFVLIWTTGKVLSLKALKEISSDELQSEFGPFTESDIVRLLPTGEDLEFAKQKVDAKKSKKKDSKKRHAEDQGSDSISKKVSKAAQIATTASKTVGEQSANSEVFKNLFHTGNETDKHDRDLFMSVAGMRYTLR